MRRFIAPLLLAASALALGCSRTEEAKPAAPPEENAPVAAAPAPAQEPAKPYAGVDYTCADGTAFNAKLDKGNALVTIGGKTSTLTPVEGATNAQFSGDGLTFVAQGAEATLAHEGSAPQSCKAKS